MAENGSEYETVRESCVYVSAEIQGTLERKKGVLGGKSKQWCSLQGHTLYLQKKQGDVMETIDLRDAQQVRKIASEYTGTHFEINMKKKNHVFICPSSENCTAWVTALQTAMARTSSSSQCNNTVNTTLNAEDKNVYSEVDESLMSVSGQCSPPSLRIQKKFPAKLSDYTEPYDQDCNAVKKENDYWEVGDFKKNPHKSQIKSEQVYDNGESERPFTGHMSVVSNSATKTVCSQEVCLDVYSQVNKIKNNPTSQSNTESSNETYMRRDSSSCKSDGSHNAYKNVKFTQSEDSLIPTISPAVGEDDLLFQTLTDSLTDRSSPIREYIHPLVDEDRKPLEDLTKYLRNNLEICRVSYSCIPVNSDPVSSLKLYLGNLDISLKDLDNNKIAAKQLHHMPSAATRNLTS